MTHHLLQLLAMQAPPPLRPPSASKLAGPVDQLFYTLTGITLFFTILIFGAIFVFMIKYRRRSEDEVPPRIEGSSLLEASWIVIPVIINVVLFLWAATLYLGHMQPPPGATEIFVIGKQWMWQVQHAEGPREINSLHVPAGVPIKLTMISEDVIHDFFVPAFRSKMDVLPGRYTQQWFEATATGAYHLFCAQYCGTLHSGMTGTVYVMKPSDYADWLENSAAAESMEQAGKRLFAKVGCGNCHAMDGSGAGPSLAGIFGKSKKLANGDKRVVDGSFIREMIVRPETLQIAARGPRMPSFQGQLTELEVLEVIQYIKSLQYATETRLRR